MIVKAYVIEYLDGTFEYVHEKLLRGMLYVRRSKKPTCYKKVVLSRDEAIRRKVVMI